MLQAAEGRQARQRGQLAADVVDFALRLRRLVSGAARANTMAGADMCMSVGSALPAGMAANAAANATPSSLVPPIPSDKLTLVSVEDSSGSSCDHDLRGTVCKLRDQRPAQPCSARTSIAALSASIQRSPRRLS